jgi:hypothetical protein
MDAATAQLVRQIHDAPMRFVLAVSGGGSGAIADLLEVPGASRTLLEAAVPYAEASMIAWLGGRPDHFCAPRTARAMAVAAFARARRYGAADDMAAGIACTASLSSDRPKRGGHRAHVALQTARRTATWSLDLQKGRHARAEEEHLVSRLVLTAVAEAGAVHARLDLPLVEGEQVAYGQTIATPAWQDLFLGKVELVCEAGNLGSCPTMVILPGAFNPLHDGHRRMAAVAQQALSRKTGAAVPVACPPLAMELSVLNVDKPPLDYTEIERRIRQFPPEQPVWLTRAATFVEKSQLFPGATFVVGIDTLQRIAEPRYYGSQAAYLASLQQIAARECRFLVFGRYLGAGFVRLGNLDLPEVLRSICDEVPPEQFREDISSTALRGAEEW